MFGRSWTAALSATMAAGAPPEVIAGKFLAAISKRRHREGTRGAMTALGHLGFGVVIGSIFALLDRRVRLPSGPAVRGIVYATLVWAASYKGQVPALGLMPPPERDRPGRSATMLVAHWVFGWTLGLIAGRR